MMHPLQKRPLVFLLYVSFWVLVSIVHFILLYSIWGIQWGEALTLAISNYLVVPSLVLTSWVFIRLFPINKERWKQNVLFHLLIASAYSIGFVFLMAFMGELTEGSGYANFNELFAQRLIVNFLIYLLHFLFIYLFTTTQTLEEKVKSQKKLEGLVKDAELNALKAQINPHFLFNSLNSISSLTMTDPAKAQEMIIKLSNFMRYSLQHTQDDLCSLSSELNNAQLYLEIEKVRFGNKLQLDIQMADDTAELLLPNRILQPLLENAIKYGVYEADHEVCIRIDCKKVRHYLVVAIYNNYEPSCNLYKGEGIGLKNIKERLEIIYNNPHLLQVKNENNEFRVALNIPQKETHG